MKIMVEIDTTNLAEVRILESFFNDLGDLAVSKANQPEAKDEVPSKYVTDVPPTLEQTVAAGLTFPPASLDPDIVAPSNVVQLHAPVGPDKLVEGYDFHKLPPMPPMPPGPPEAPQYDANGMPWDARIHASNKAVTIGLAWKYKRGVDEVTKAAVEASLPRGAPVNASPAPGAAPQAPMPPLPPTPSAPPAPPAIVHSGVGSVVLPSTAVASTPSLPPTMPPGPPPPNFPPPAHVEPEIDFATLMIKVSEAMGANQLTHDQITAKIKPLGLDNLFTLSSRPDLVGHAAAALGF